MDLTYHARRTALTALALGGGLNLSLHSQQIGWLSTYGPPMYSSADFGIYGFRMAGTSSGGAYGCGTIGGIWSGDMDGITPTYSGDLDAILVKWDSTGTAEWVRTYGGVPELVDDDGGKLVYTHPADGGALLLGEFNSHIELGPDEYTETNDTRSTFVARVAPDGECLWGRSIRGGGIQLTKALFDGSNDAYVFGYCANSPGFVGRPDVVIPGGSWMVRYRPDGSLATAKHIVTAGAITGAAWNSSATWLLSFSGHAGTSLYNQPVNEQSEFGCLALIDTIDAVNWKVVWPGLGGGAVGPLGVVRQGAHAVVYGLVREGGIVMNDTIITGGEYVYEPFITSYSLAGEPEWIVRMPNAWIRELRADPNGSLLVYGQFNDSLRIGTRVFQAVSDDPTTFIAQFDTLGNCTAFNSYGRAWCYWAGMDVTSHGIYVSGSYMNQVQFGPVALPLDDGMYVTRLDAVEGYTGITRTPGFYQDELLIYANPNNGLCTVQLPTHLRFTNGLLLSVFDQTGQLVQRVPVTLGNAGVQVDIRAEAKGIYHVELGDGEQRYTGRIVFE